MNFSLVLRPHLIAHLFVIYWEIGHQLLICSSLSTAQLSTKRRFLPCFLIDSCCRTLVEKLNATNDFNHLGKKKGTIERHHQRFASIFLNPRFVFSLLQVLVLLTSKSIFWLVFKNVACHSQYVKSCQTWRGEPQWWRKSWDMAGGEWTHHPGVAQKQTPTNKSHSPIYTYGLQVPPTTPKKT